MDTTSFKPAAEPPLNGFAAAGTRDRLLRPGYRNYVLAMIYAAAYFLNVLWVAPTFVAIQALVPTTMRVSATAWKLLFTNLIGLGLGPQLVGAASDLFAKAKGSGSLRSAMLLCACSLVAPTILYLIAANFMRGDLAAANARVEV